MPKLGFVARIRNHRKLGRRRRNPENDDDEGVVRVHRTLKMGECIDQSRFLLFELSRRWCRSAHDHQTVIITESCMSFRLGITNDNKCFGSSYCPSIMWDHSNLPYKRYR